MGLDVYLIGEEKTVECICECGHKHSKTEREVLYDANITHNLNAMADAAGIYEVCWHPEKIGAVKAKSIIEKLTLGLNLLKKDPKQFKKLDFPRGTYEEFVFWVES